jgi:hypothetical protein
MTVTLQRDDAPPVTASGFDVDLSPCAFRVGELYAVMVPDHNAVLVLEFRIRLSSGVLRFVRPDTGQEFHFHQAQCRVRPVGDRETIL